MGQNNYVEQRVRSHKRRFDFNETNDVLSKSKPNLPKRELIKIVSKKTDSNKKYKEKVLLKQQIKAKKTSITKAKPQDSNAAPVPVFLLGQPVSQSKKISNDFKEKRKEMAKSKIAPIVKLPAINEFEVLKELRTGKKGKKSWKRVVRKVTFVGEDFTRKPPKLEKYIRPSALRHKKVNVIHPTLNTTFCLDIIGVKENPQSKLYSGLGIITKGTILEVNVAPLGKVTVGGKVVWAKYAQVTNKPELDACINAVLLV
eukprot:GAHX01000574.1.p1 GENE.GAHX01000574.1~~GAHX01000574.1.p1  ORF type:complete len:257 (+),score=44.88 GAHX01000574.1:35-805(+)